MNATLPTTLTSWKNCRNEKGNNFVHTTVSTIVCTVRGDFNDRLGMDKICGDIGSSLDSARRILAGKKK
jgi:hypothetical protein